MHLIRDNPCLPSPPSSPSFSPTIEQSESKLWLKVGVFSFCKIITFHLIRLICLAFGELVKPVSKVKILVTFCSLKENFWKFEKSAPTGEREAATLNKESLRVKTHKWICRGKENFGRILPPYHTQSCTFSVHHSPFHVPGSTEEQFQNAQIIH